MHLRSQVVVLPPRHVHRDRPRHPADAEIFLLEGDEKVGRVHIVHGSPGLLVPWLRSVYATGMADHLDSETRSKVGLIEYIEIHPAYRGKGLARRLMMEALSWLARKRVQVVYLQASSEVGGIPEDVLVRFYEGLGFEDLGPLNDLSGNPLMVLELADE